MSLRASPRKRCLTTYPDAYFGRKPLAALASMLDANLPIPLRRAERRPGDTTHTRARRAASTNDLDDHGRIALFAFQRDLEARGLADRVRHPRLVGVRTAARGERLAPGPTTERAGPLS